MHRTLLVLSTPFLLAGLSATTRAEETALAAIKKIGGSVRLVTESGKDLEVEFQLRGRELTDEGLAHIAALKHVVSLNLRDTKITSAGLVHLKGLTSLRRLHLERTAVDDEGIEHLAGLANLEYLNLYKTKVTDKSLRHLTGLKRLRRLYAWQTGVTAEGAATLEKALPDLKIVRGVDLSKLPDKFPPPEAKRPKPKTALKWVAVTSRDEAPKRSLNGDNTQVYFENKSKLRVRIYWITYGGGLKLYGELDPGGTRQQNTYSRNAWLITDERDQPLGYFVVKPEEALAVIPGGDKPG